MTENDGKVFISYRRKVSVWQAWVIFLLLREIHYEEVWFDLVTQDSGPWKENIRGAIDISMHFVLILAPGDGEKEGTLDRCRNESDILREEIEYAIKRKNMVIIFVDGFSWEEERKRLVFNGYFDQIPFFDELSSLHGHTVNSDEGLESDLKEINRRYLQWKENIETQPISSKNIENTLRSTAKIILPGLLGVGIDPNKILAVEPVINSLRTSNYFSSTGGYLGLSENELTTWIEDEAESILSGVGGDGSGRLTIENGNRADAASFFVRNNKDQNVTNLRGYVIKFARLGGKPIWEGDHPLPWLTNGSHLSEEIILVPNETMEVHVASIKDEKSFYTSEVFGEETPFNNKFSMGSWVFNIELRGLVNDLKFSKQVLCRVSMGNENTISLEIIKP